MQGRKIDIEAVNMLIVTPSCRYIHYCLPKTVQNNITNINNAFDVVIANRMTF